MKNCFTKSIIATAVVTCFSAQSEIVISEFVIGSDSKMSAVELYNSGNDAIDLKTGGYALDRFVNNGDGATRFFKGNGKVANVQLSFANATQAQQNNSDEAYVLQPGETLIVATGVASLTDLPNQMGDETVVGKNNKDKDMIQWKDRASNQFTWLFSGNLQINPNQEIRLFKNYDASDLDNITGDLVDVVGNIADPEWAKKESLAAPFNLAEQIENPDVPGEMIDNPDLGKLTFRRNIDSLTPSTSFDIAEWSVHAKDTRDDLGKVTIGEAPVEDEPDTELEVPVVLATPAFTVSGVVGGVIDTADVPADGITVVVSVDESANAGAMVDVVVVGGGTYSKELPADWDGELINIVLPASLFVVAGEQTDIEVSITAQVKAALDSDNTDSAVSDVVTFTVLAEEAEEAVEETVEEAVEETVEEAVEDVAEENTAEETEETTSEETTSEETTAEETATEETTSEETATEETATEETTSEETATEETATEETATEETATEETATEETAAEETATEETAAEETAAEETAAEETTAEETTAEETTAEETAAEETAAEETTDDDSSTNGGAATGVTEDTTEEDNTEEDTTEEDTTEEDTTEEDTTEEDTTEEDTVAEETPAEVEDNDDGGSMGGFLAALALPIALLRRRRQSK